MTKKEFKKALKAVDEKAWKRFKSEVGEEDLDCIIEGESTASDVILSAFSWRDGHMGWDYWNEIFNKVYICE